MKKKPPKRQLVKILFSKTKSGFDKDRFYIKVAGKTGKMLDFYAFLYEVKQLEFHVHQYRDTLVFKIGKKVHE